jgi:2-methylaconitate cis-trans-isomerase PrpF
MTDGTFPTGNRVDVLDVPSVGEIEVSLLDVSNPCAFVRARDVGLTGSERPEEIDDDPAVLERLETIRSAACARLGLVDDAERATTESPGVPKMAIVGERQRYETVAGETVSADDYDLLARIMSMQKAHHAYAVTGAMCTATAALLPGTIPSEFVAGGASDAVRLGHPKGTMRVGVDVDGDEVSAAVVDRTARQIMDGRLFDPEP